jgi:hypothetical protein
VLRVFEVANRRGEGLDLGRSRRLVWKEGNPRGREGARVGRWVAALALAPARQRQQQQRLRPIQRLPFSTLASVDLHCTASTLVFYPRHCGPEVTTEFVSRSLFCVVRVRRCAVVI